MKIGIFNPYLDDLGGGEKYMMTIGQCLADNHDVSIFWDNKEDLTKLTDRFGLDMSKISLVKNIFSPNVNKLERLVVSRTYDAIFVLSDGSIPYVLSKKLFVHFQQPLPHLSIPLKTRIKLNRVNAFFCNSNFTKSFIDKTFNIKSEVVYPPVSFYAKKTKKENIILTVGRLRVKDVRVAGQPVGDYKKQGTLIDVFKKMVEEGLSGWRFVIGVSVQKEEEKILLKMQQSCKGFPIEFVVNKNNEELWEVYNRAKIYWHAAGFGEDLEKYPQYAEHFGMSTVEAMGAGAVPVVINAGGQKEIVEDGENGLFWNTLDELKKKTLLLTNNPKKLEALSAKAEKKAKDFSKDRFCIRIHEILAE